MLYREPKLLKVAAPYTTPSIHHVSVLYREPKLLKALRLASTQMKNAKVSVLYREPKLLKGLYWGVDNLRMRLFQCSTVSRNC